MILTEPKIKPTQPTSPRDTTADPGSVNTALRSALSVEPPTSSQHCRLSPCFPISPYSPRTVPYPPLPTMGADAAHAPPPHGATASADPGRPRSPPPPRKDKPVPPTPPLHIKDRGRGVTYSRTGFLGEVSKPLEMGDKRLTCNRAASLVFTRWLTRRRPARRSRWSTRRRSRPRRTKPRWVAVYAVG